jgi:hypothetical protein
LLGGAVAGRATASKDNQPVATKNTCIAGVPDTAVPPTVCD